MSSTIQGIDARGYLIGWLKGLTAMISADINAVPDDKWTATFGGCTKPANVLTADAIGLLYWCTEAMNNEPPTGSGDEFMKKLAADCATKPAAIAKLAEASEGFAAALAQASDEKLSKEVMPPWQMPAPLFMIAQIAVSHIWYHDGQLNYIHQLLGDDKIHWMGD